MSIEKELEEIKEVQKMCEEFLGREVTLDEVMLISFVFTRGKHYGVRTVLEKITELL